MSKQDLIEAMADLDEDAVVEQVKALRNLNVPGLDIIGYLQEGMSIVGKKYETKEYFLSELIMSAEIFKGISAMLKDDFEQAGPPKYGTFVIGTIYGDVHDIGKDIVTTVVGCNGFKVIDLGVDVPTAKYIEAIKEHRPQIVGMSCLLTTAFDNIKEAIKSIGDAGLRNNLTILIGGGPVDEATRRYVDADAVCKNPQEAVELSKKYVGGDRV
ncbi:MAG: cobalamin-dependent protein [Syntrophorhabdales bacterium]|jgi:methanogenic corrinoid protein MtbC1